MVMVKAWLGQRRFLITFVMLIVATYLLAPRFWEPGAESWKNWESARVLKETGGFGVMAHGVLYSLYLQIWHMFDYPLSMQLEHVVTRLFLNICVCLLLRRFLPRGLAVVLACAWIPYLWIIEAGSRAIGIGFLCLYFSQDRKSFWNKGFIPLSLGAGALCDTSSIPYLIGHLIGAIYERFAFWGASTRSNRSFFSSAGKLGLALVVVLLVAFQSDREDNNVHAYVYPWVPFPQNEIFTVAVLTYANWEHIKATVPEEEHFLQDWYFTHRQVFGDASTLFQAVVNNPGLMIRHIKNNLVRHISTPLNLVFGFGVIGHHSLSSMISCFLMVTLIPLAIYRVSQRFSSSPPQFAALVIGASGSLFALLMVTATYRYSAVLLPVALIVVSHLGSTVAFLGRQVADWRTWFLQEREEYGRKLGMAMTACGICLILIGFAANERVLVPLLSPDGDVGKLTRVAILVIEGALIAVGLSVWRWQSSWIALGTRVATSSYDNRQSRVSVVVILIIAGSVLWTSPWPRVEAKSVWDHVLIENVLSGSQPVSMDRSYRSLLSGLGSESKVLALESPWLRSFGFTGLDNVIHPLSLPPFVDTSGDTERLLSGLDEIWVSRNFASKVPSLATQVYLRYHLHVEPFLQEALTQGWTKREVPSYGTVYRRPSS